MIKSVLTIGLWIMVLLLGFPQVGSSEDMEDHFVDPDFSTVKNVFIDVNNVSLVNVLKILSQQTGLSFIASQDVAEKKITLYLNKVPFNQALQTILDVNGLTYKMEDDSNVFVVTAKFQTEKTKITKVYQLKYATVSSSKLNSTISISSNSGGNGKSGGISTGGLEEVIKDSLSADGKAVEDARTNSLIITDVPGQFPIIESTIAKLDVPIPQIYIEVEMIDVSKSKADQLGVSYGSAGTFSPLTFSGGSKSINYPFSTSNPVTQSEIGTLYTPGSFSASGMQAALQLLTTSTDARTLARPKILTLNNETAQIEISTDQAISIQTTQTSTTGTNSTLSAVTPERYTTGVILKVTPQANLVTHEITMAVSPKVVDVIASTIQGTSATSQIFDPETRGSDSILKLKDGQTMVIGGLIRDQDNKTINKIPVLGDLPLIGAAFRSVSRTKQERELIIFLTPHIVDDPDQLNYNSMSSSGSTDAALDDVQSATDRAQDINSALNNIESK